MGDIKEYKYVEMNSGDFQTPYMKLKKENYDFIGIVQENRFFSLSRNNPQRLSYKYISDTLEKYDCIVEESKFSERVESIYNSTELTICREVITVVAPEYITCFDYCLESNLYNPSDMLITSRNLFLRYRQWMVSIIEEMCRREENRETKTSFFEIYSRISSVLLRVWIMKQGLRVREEYVYNVIPRELDSGIKLIELKKKYVKVVLEKLTSQYKSGQVYDLVDINPIKKMGEKIPVWVCWWQGINSAPEIVQICIKSIQKYLPMDKAELHIITMQNLGEYITLPDWIIEKFGQGKITMTHLSDILRFALLYRYGGLWMDATYYVTANLFDEIFEKYTFYTQRLEKPEWRIDVSMGRWAGNFLYGHKGDFFFRFMLNSFYEYWRREEELIDYYFIDYVIDLAYDQFEQVRNQFQMVPCSNPFVLKLLAKLNDCYDERKFDELIESNYIFKLSYKVDVSKSTIVGKETYYAKLCELINQ